MVLKPLNMILLWSSKLPLPKSSAFRSFFTKTPSSPLNSQAKMEALVAEVASLRAQLHQLQTQKKSPCQGVTGKGTPCRNGALPGAPYCRMHSREPKAPKAPRIRKEPKPKKIIPEHVHPIGESHPLCPLCQTHGDCMDPTLPNHHFEGAQQLREILCHYEVCGATESVWSADWPNLVMDLYLLIV